MLQNWLSPLNTKFEKSNFFDARFETESDFPELLNAKVAFVVVDKDFGDKIRIDLNRFKNHFSDLSIVDIGDVRKKNSEFILQMIMFFAIFIAPYIVMLFNQIYLYVNRDKLVKEKEEVPYNRYRPEIKQEIVEPEKTLAQTQREKNAIRGLTLLYEAGLLSDEEFERKKKKVLSSK